MDHVRDELGHVITGQAAGRTDSTQITLYNSVGLGIQDIATARMIVDHARQRAIGSTVPLAAPHPALAGPQ